MKIKKQRKFNVTSFYCKTESPFGLRKCKHAITERFENVPERDVSDLVIELLDVPFETVDGKRVVTEPTVERLQKDGLTGCGESWTKRELAREKKAKAAYDEIIKFVNDPAGRGPRCMKLSPDSEIAISIG